MKLRYLIERFIRKVYMKVYQKGLSESSKIETKQPMNTVKSNLSKLPNSVPTNYPLKAYSSLNTDVKTHRDFIKKIAEPFICYKHLQSEQQQITIAGYKTSGLHPNKSAFSSRDYSITKDAVEKYIFTFCFEAGCDLPFEEQIKLIYSLLVAHSKACRGNDDFMNEKCGNNEDDSMKMSTFSHKKKQQDTVRKPSLYLLIKLCLETYIKAKQSSIGGIFQRLVIEIRKEIQAHDQNDQSLSSSKAEQCA